VAAIDPADTAPTVEIFTISLFIPFLSAFIPYWAIAEETLTDQAVGSSSPPQSVTPDFTRKTECISYVRQDQFTHT
jgi:hypothetical protein